MEKVKLNVKETKETKLPSNLEAEQALIGSVLVNNDIIDEISNIVNSTKFHDPIHKKIFEVIESLNNKGMIANPITLKNFFENDNSLSEVGGVDYLVKLTRFSSSSRQAVDYAKLIHETFVKRELIYISENIQIKPLMRGGAQERNMRAGTENIYGIAAMAKAMEMAHKNMAEETKYIKGTSQSFRKTWCCFLNCGQIYGHQNT